ncbi:unnamed protein product [Ostreobium quekettii]|uniref:glutamine--tRNA ligase n=1 Tax=Ostreobium quekettii TaxID=121088 RepID=A0A8S1IR87_9CHLO|nr:unnamed protein product [Ostreobium quekettii]|eukprot:evm.model.scf_347.3 EVM.evm.TU.scf_347.3   scf_347:15514-23656(+)
MASREEQEAEALRRFLGIGLAETTAKDSVKNAKKRQALLEVISEAGVEDGCPKAMGALLNSVATKCPAKALEHRKVVARYVKEEKIKTNAQLDGALDYLKSLGTASLDLSELEAASGVGVVVSVEEIKAAVAQIIQEKKETLLEERYQLNLNVLIGQVTRTLKFADGGCVRSEFQQQVEDLLGPKTEEDVKAAGMKKPKKAKAPKEKSTNGEKNNEDSSQKNGSSEEESWRTADPFAFLPKPEDNHQVHTTVNFSDGTVMHVSNTEEQLRAHLSETGGKVITRFPPEPNGYLHIGHCKAMFVDFGMAAQYDGHCFLRFDDTNPEAEKMEYIEHIQEIVGWMGWTPWKVTYSSDYFDQLYELALKLISSGHAYVCHQTADEIKDSRQERQPSPWRDRPVEESLRLFKDMKNGLVEEGAATLRMRMDHKNENYNMFDLIAYRVKFAPHPHAGDKWCIYPSYDYTHCIVDALENISHSLCTLEFESRRASYYWLLEVLGLYKPHVMEYSRLNLTHNVLSKRKLKALVDEGHVRGWDDPRMYTISGLRRRGYTPAAINTFIREMGITRSDNEVPVHRLEHHVRMDLDAASPRVMAVLRPLQVIITNLPDDHYEEVVAQRFPGRKGDTYKVPFSKIVYIEATDFREVDSKDYYGLAPGKAIMLRYAYPLQYVDHKKNDDGVVTQVMCTYDAEFHSAQKNKKPPKGVLNWVGQPAPGVRPMRIEARLYDVLFKDPSPSELRDAWRDGLNEASEETLKGAMGCPELRKAKVGDRFQFERLGYFCVDRDTSADVLVVNRTVTLRESFPKFGKA